MILVIDCNNMAHKAMHVQKGLEYKGKPVWVIFGFLRQLFTVCKKFNTNKVVLCWDSKTNHRLDIDPTYKHKRRSKEYNEEQAILRKQGYAQFTLLRRKILPALGFGNVLIKKGYEADDLIARVVFDLRKKDKKEPIMIVSGDEDLYQLLRDNVSILQKKAGRDFVVTKKWFANKYEVKPKEWAECKAIAGCTSDSIKGIKGVGPHNACQYIIKRKGGKWTMIMQAIEDFLNSKKGGKIIKRNLVLTTLPFKHKDYPVLKVDIDFKEDCFLSSEIKRVLKRYGFESMTTANYLHGVFNCLRAE